MDLELTEKYFREQTHAACTAYLNNQINPLLNSCLHNMRNVVFSVERRVKTPESFNDKIRRKNYERPIQEIVDIIGVRIITYFEEGVDYVAQELRQNLFVDESSSYDNANELDVTSFGYRSVHIVGNIPGYEETKPTEMFSESGRFEIQVRSILQHAWANMSHLSDYKKQGGLPSDQRRRLFRLAALLESADEQFSMIRENSLRYREGYAELSEEELLSRDINFYSVEAYLRTFLNMEYWEGLAEGIGFDRKPSLSHDYRYHGDALYSANCVYRVLLTAKMLDQHQIMGLHAITKSSMSEAKENLEIFFQVCKELNLSFRAVGPDIVVVIVSMANARYVPRDFDWGQTFYRSAYHALLEACNRVDMNLS